MYNITIDNDLRKALTTASDTTGTVLINELFKDDIHDLVLSETPVLNRVSHMEWPTLLYNYRRQTSDPGAFSLGDFEDLPVSDHSTYERENVILKYHYNLAQISGPMERAAGDWISLLPREISNASRGLGRYLEQQIMWGNSATDPRQMDGILKQITTNAIDFSEGGTRTDGFVLNDIDVWLDGTKGYADTMISSRAFARRLNSLLQVQLRIVEQTTIDGGFTVNSYRGIPMLRLDNELDAQLGDGNVVLFDHNKVNYVVNLHPEVGELQKFKDARTFLIRTYSAVAVEDENWHATKISNVVTAVDA